MSGIYLLIQHPSLYLSFDQRVWLDFTIPNLFNVKGKIGAYERIWCKTALAIFF